ncbi:hypothetical protein HOLleu_35560 [Holothuria leucospilota]|uniref:Uncharacterized protein n=1 Tax=Holothuria leucospilota TaxID=206669 RepID=A0A9Q1BFZ7_HOLLE|nr:hypothetical protein HOLleu_35560 [Holothuria leucospilota]
MATAATKEYVASKEAEVTHAVYNGKVTDRGRTKSTTQSTHRIRSNTKHVVRMDRETDPRDEETPTDSHFGLYHLKDSNTHNSPYVITMSFGESKIVNVSIEIDTAAARLTIPETVYRSKLSDLYPLKKCDAVLRGHTREVVPILGCIAVPLRFKKFAFARTRNYCGRR